MFEPVLEALDTHLRVRERGTPILTTLVGPPGAALRSLADWARSRGFRVENLGLEDVRQRLRLRGPIQPRGQEPPAHVREARRPVIHHCPATLSLDPLALLQVLLDLTQLIEAEPEMHLAICLDAARLRALEALGQAPHALAMVRESLVEISQNQAAAQPPILAALGASRFVADAYALAEARLRGLEPSAPTVDHGAARSAAEAFLAEVLAEVPETYGCFLPNVLWEAEDGTRLEIDLYARSLGIAIEVDGYHHFPDADRYRRDRRKDVALQRGGLLVLRFLADDVVDRVEEILRTIVAAVAWRRRR